MADRIRWGILSTASIARGRFVPAVQQSRYGTVAAVASRSRDKAEAFAREFNIPRAYGSYDDLIADPDIDAIYIATPNSEHARWSIRCAEAGKPVLCEKPLASNAAEAQQMVDAFASRDIPFTEGFMYRFHPQTERVKSLIGEGRIGAVKVISAAFSFVARDDEVAMNRQLAGGSLMDVGCYCVNLMRYITGEEPEHVTAYARYGQRSGVDETFLGLLTFPSTVAGHFDSGLNAYKTNTYEIRGTDGRITVDVGFDIEPDEETIIRCWSGDRYEELRIPPANHFTIMADDFARALLDGRPPRFPPSDAVLNMQVIDRLVAAARTL